MGRRLVLVCLLLGGCQGASGDRGLELPLRVRGGQLERAPLGGDAGGPRLSFVELLNPSVRIGEGGRRLSGRTAAGALSVHLGILGDPTHWVVPVGFEDAAVPGELDWEAVCDFQRSLPPGPFVIGLQAVDGAGRGGPVVQSALLAIEDVPEGELVFTLEWDRPADLDLLVTDPLGNRLGPDNLNSYQPPLPGRPPDPPEAWTSGGILDQDSGAGCVVDGRYRENAVWASSPPLGRYLVEVALKAACGEERAGFQVTARRHGVVVADRRGVLYAADGRASPDSPPAALRVLELDVGP